MTAAELYQQIEEGLSPFQFEVVEALSDGILIVVKSGQEFWLTAQEQPS